MALCCNFPNIPRHFLVSIFSVQFFFSETVVNTEQTSSRKGTNGMEIKLFVCTQFMILEMNYERDISKDLLGTISFKFYTVSSRLKITFK
jgi:hypothetical protein